VALIIDSTVLIHVERQQLPLERLALEVGEELGLSVVTLSELLTGAYRSDSAARKEQRLAYVRSVTKAFRTIPIDDAIAHTHARLWADLAARGTPIGERDLWIAATALTRGMGVLTHNVREFRRIPELTVIQAQT
jgi:tRNA(fMet)-specific endonuclease VapC